MHVMIDLETLGLRPGSVILSIGAVTFDPFGTGHLQSFSRNILRSSCERHGMTVDRGTLDWWERQSPEARAALDIDQRPFLEVAVDFHQWFRQQGGVEVWCQGANFDSVLWEAACAMAGTLAPWRYYNVRDTRTIYDLARLGKTDVERQGTHHSALDDASHQVLCIQESYRRIAGVPA